MQIVGYKKTNHTLFSIIHYVQPSLSRATPPTPFSIVIGRTKKGFYLSLADQFKKILKISVNFRCRKTPTT